MEAAKYFILIAVSAILLLFWGCFSTNNAQGDWPSLNFMDEYSAANTGSFTAFGTVLMTLFGLSSESQASSEEKTLKLRIERDISTNVFKMIVILIANMIVMLTAVFNLAVRRYQTPTKRTALRQIHTKKMGGLGLVENTESGQKQQSVSEASPPHSMGGLKTRLVQAKHRVNQQKHSVKHKQPALCHCFESQRGQQFQQSVTMYPGTISFGSNFVSGSFQQPGSTQELYKEGVRLATFKDFPVSIPVSALRLAQAGFYYLGEGDQVKCFNCGTTYQGWQLGDRPAAIHARISPHCTLVQGSDRTNLPITNAPNFSVTEPSMERSYGSLAGPGSGGSRSASVMDPDSEQSDSYRPMLVTATGGGGPSQLLTRADPSYARDSTRSWISSSSDGSAPAVSEGRGAPAAASAATPSSVATPGNSMLSGGPPPPHTTPVDRGRPRHLSRRLDLRDAVYPQYMQPDDRRRSFSTWTWPGLPPADELVRLGFFYAGYADCVRCFFCGVGLRSWGADDIPAEVHARRSPTCQYLRLIKGDEFVDDVASGMARGPREAALIAQCEEDQKKGRLRGQPRQTLRQSPPVWHQHQHVVPAEAVAFPCGHRLCLHCMPRPGRLCPVCGQRVIQLVPE